MRWGEWIDGEIAARHAEVTRKVRKFNKDLTYAAARTAEANAVRAADRANAAWDHWLTAQANELEARNRATELLKVADDCAARGREVTREEASQTAAD